MEMSRTQTKQQHGARRMRHTHRWNLQSLADGIAARPELARAHLAEVLGGARHSVREELHPHAALRLRANAHVEEDCATIFSNIASAHARARAPIGLAGFDGADEDRAAAAAAAAEAAGSAIGEMAKPADRRNLRRGVENGHERCCS